jgi:formylglycine-generating enzyme required for sulfatase activity
MLEGEHQLGDAYIRGLDGMKMVFVPSGQFEMGMSEVELNLAMQACESLHGEGESCQRKHYQSSRPVHPVALDSYWIDKVEVTNAQFVAFLNELGNQVEEDVYWWEPGAGSRGVIYGYIKETDGGFSTQPGFDDYPVIEVSWYGAAAYCAWVGGRLPTEAEWAYAARGPQSNIYPWGNTFNGKYTNYCDTTCTYQWKDTNFNDGFSSWAPGGSYPDGASWCGALDMSGNIWEWVNDWWSENYYAHSPTDNPQGPDAGTLRIARGGSWYDENWRVSASIRKALTPSSYRMHWVGFRCVIPASIK